MAIVEETAAAPEQEAAPAQDTAAPEAQDTSSQDLDLESLVGDGVAPQSSSDDTGGPPATEESTESSLAAPEAGGDPQPPPEPQAPSLIDRMQQMGFEGITDESQAIDRLMDWTLQQSQQVEQLQTQLQTQQPLVQYGQQYLSQTTAPPEQQQLQETPAEDPVWNPPEYNKAAADRWLERDETGRAKWKEGTPDEIKQRTEDYIQYLENFQDKFHSNPPEAIQPFVQPWIEQEVQRQVAELMEQSQAQAAQQQNLQFADEVFEQNQEWLYQKDPRTNQPLRDINGRYMFTPHGEAQMRNLELVGDIQDPQTRWTVATQMTAAQMLPYEPAPQASPAEIAEQKKLQHLTAGANSIPPRGGSLANAQADSQAQNPQQSAGHSFLDALKT